jgi:hypothetical protein
VKSRRPVRSRAVPGIQFFPASPTLFLYPESVTHKWHTTPGRACRPPQTPPHPKTRCGSSAFPSLRPNSFPHPPYFSDDICSLSVFGKLRHIAARKQELRRAEVGRCAGAFAHFFSTDRYLDPERSFPLLQQLPIRFHCCRGSIAPAASCFEFPLGLSALNRLRLKGVWAADLQQVPCPSRELPREPDKPTSVAY